MPEESSQSFHTGNNGMGMKEKGNHCTTAQAVPLSGASRGSLLMAKIPRGVYPPRGGVLASSIL